MSSPWGKIEKPEIVNFHEIMSEQVAADLAKKEENKLIKKDIDEIKDIPEDVLQVIPTENAQSDEEIARLLQAMYDKEHDEQLKRNVEKFNGASKISISFKNYMRSSLNQDYYDSEEEEEIEDVKDRKDWDRFDANNREINSIPTRGYKIKDGNIVTKHDTTINGRKNACKLLSFPPGFQTGDGELMDLKLNNKVFNSLAQHSRNEATKKHKLHDKREDRATVAFGLDQYTTLILYKMLNQLLQNFNGIISTGKEAVILHADGNVDCEKIQVPKECVIKVFKTTLSEFKQRDKYIKGDHRFKDRIGKQTSKKTVHLWAEKEMANLCRLKKAGIPCPEVIFLKEHVLVMSFIGENNIPAKKLKEAIMDAADYIIAYDQIVEMMKILFQNANLIHADLSEYNILWNDGQCYFIDVSQAVEPIHENAFHFLMRDCRNITNYFHRKSVPNVLSQEELFELITGHSFENKEEILNLQLREKPKPHKMDDFQSTDNFEKIWDSIKNEVEPLKA